MDHCGVSMPGPHTNTHTHKHTQLTIRDHRRDVFCQHLEWKKQQCARIHTNRAFKNNMVLRPNWGPNQYSNSRTFLNPYLKLSYLNPPDSFNLFTPSCSKSSIYVHTYGLWMAGNPHGRSLPGLNTCFPPSSPTMPQSMASLDRCREVLISVQMPALIYSPCQRGGQRKRILKERP